jgi:hypothetical protein
MRRAPTAETGSSIVIAMVLMTMMFAVGLAAYAFVDNQQVESMRERHRESSFNFAEAVLNSQSFVLSRRWAGSQNSYGTATPTCSNASAPAAMCPNPTELTAAFASTDYATGATWTATVYDDVGGPFYDATVEAVGTAHWDLNDNGTVWIKAETVVRGRLRRLVALVQVQPYQEQIPKNVIIAGQFELTPNGNGVYIKTNPDETSEHKVTLRCTLTNPDCAEYIPDPRKPQLEPAAAIEGDSFVGKDALPEDVQQRLKERAEADGTAYTGCPSEGQLTGKVVYVEGCADGKYTNNYTWNSEASPGILIWADGFLELGGRSTFWGIVYHLNNDNSSDDELLRLRGGLTINGGAFVDGPGGIDVGSNQINLNYFEGAFTSITSYGSASIVQNSWRDITGGE